MITLEPPQRLPADADVWRAVGLSRGGLTRFLGSARRAVGLSGEVDVLLAGDRTLRKLNREFRGKDKATDVLSFPAASEIFEEHAGDLAVSLETALRQADEHGHGLAVEVRVLMLHGLLHLAGMDHEVDRGEMAAREAELRKKLRLPLGLIARVEESFDAKGAKVRKGSGGLPRKAGAGRAECGDLSTALRSGRDDSFTGAKDSGRARKKVAA